METETVVETIQYNHIDAFSRSQMMDILISPEYFHKKHILKEIPEKETIATLMGTAKHCALLEPERFESDYNPIETIFLPREDVAELQKKYKAKWKTKPGEGPTIILSEPATDDAKLKMIRALEEAYETKNILLPSMTKEVHNQIDSLTNNQMAKNILEKVTHTERILTGEIKTKHGKFPVKARLDAHGEKFILDFKTTTKDLTPEKYVWDAINQGVDIQSSLYREIFRQNFENTPRFFVLLQNNNSFASVVYEAQLDFIDHGERRMYDALDRLAYCLSRDEWPELLTYHKNCWITNQSSIFPLQFLKGENK